MKDQLQAIIDVAAGSLQFCDVCQEGGRTSACSIPCHHAYKTSFISPGKHG